MPCSLRTRFLLFVERVLQIQTIAESLTTLIRKTFARTRWPWTWLPTKASLLKAWSLSFAHRTGWTESLNFMGKTIIGLLHIKYHCDFCDVCKVSKCIGEKVDQTSRSFSPPNQASRPVNIYAKPVSSSGKRATQSVACGCRTSISMTRLIPKTLATSRILPPV